MARSDTRGKRAAESKGRVEMEDDRPVASPRNLRWAILVLVCTAVTSSVASLLLKEFVFSPAVQMQATLSKALPNPLNGGKLQFFVLQNVGRSAANDVIIKIEYPRTIQRTTDFAYDTVDRPAAVTRTDDYLRICMKRLCHDEVALVILAVGAGEIGSRDVTVLYDETKLEKDSIRQLE